MGDDEAMVEQVTVDGLSPGAVEASTFVARDGAGALRLWHGGDFGDTVIEQPFGRYKRTTDGALFSPTSVMAVLSSDDGDDQVAIGVEQR